MSDRVIPVHQDPTSLLHPSCPPPPRRKGAPVGAVNRQSVQPEAAAGVKKTLTSAAAPKTDDRGLQRMAGVHTYIGRPGKGCRINGLTGREEWDGREGWGGMGVEGWRDGGTEGWGRGSGREG